MDVDGVVASIIGVGTLIVAVLMIAAVRHGGAVRRGAQLTALSYAVWAIGCVGLIHGLPDVAFWAGVRPLIFVVLTFATASAPGVIASGVRDLLELVLEGWLTVGSVFGVAWIVAQSDLIDRHQAGLTPLMFWLVGQILLMSLVGGVFTRTQPGHRIPALVAYLVGLSVLTGDVLALASGDSRLGIPFWLGSGLVMAVSILLGGADVYIHNFTDPDQPRGIRLWQLPVPYFVAYFFVPGARSSVEHVTGALLIAAVFIQLVLHSRRNESLWGRLLERTRLHQEVLRDSQDVIVQVDSAGVVEFVNPAAARVLSVEPSALLGTVLQEHLHPDDAPLDLGAPTAVDRARAGPPKGSAERTQVRRETRFRIHPDPDPDPGPGSGGGPRWRHIEWTVSPRRVGPQLQLSGWILSGRDVSQQVALRRDLLDAARHDALTGLLNRTAFLSAVDARLQAGYAAVLFIDLDGFKSVNDTVGHGQGDELLRLAGQCLSQAVGPNDAVARLGGDEFAVLVGSDDPDIAREVAQDVVTAFNGFDESAHGRRSVSASIGIAAGRSGTAIELLRDADLAMYRAKQRGGAGLVEFEPWMSERVMEHSRLRADLETAVRAEALTLYLQPVVDLHTRQWAGFEALVRWPVGREIWSPAQFLPVAEESGLIVPMGAWVLREALRQLAGWRDDTLGMAVNVSALQLVGTEFFDVTMAALAASGVSPDRLTLEITEQAAIQDLGRTASRLEVLRSEGVHVAIDDFGTGFSSLQYLSRLPVDILKIDRKFVWGLGRQAEDDVLVRSMIGLAAELGLEVIAEGVETRIQADRLLEYGCRLAQGFLFSPPRPIEELRSTDPFVSPAPRLPRQWSDSDPISAINSMAFPTEHR